MKSKTTRKSSSRFTKRGAAGTKYKYDRESDILLITLSSEMPDFAAQSQNVITHYSKNGKPIEIEILDASEMALGVVNALRPKRGAAA